MLLIQLCRTRPYGSARVRGRVGRGKLCPLSGGRVEGPEVVEATYGTRGKQRVRQAPRVLSQILPLKSYGSGPASRFKSHVALAYLNPQTRRTRSVAARNVRPGCCGGQRTADAQDGLRLCLHASSLLPSPPRHHSQRRRSVFQ